MKIKKNTVVAMHYRLTNNAGELIDESTDTPLSFIYGIGQIVPGLEVALEGKTTGDKIDVKVDPKDAYGERNDGMTQAVPKEQLAGVPNLQVGMQLEAQAEDQRIIVTVTDIQDEHVMIDGNHPLAGVELNFAVEIVSVRDATSEELDHGHVHGPGGHDH
ncbi:MAG: FKBP-type peptidyl-prolyl cis-trans isomerase [Oligoflexus sp.]